MDDEARWDIARLVRAGLGLGCMAVGLGIFVEVYTHPKLYPWRQAAFGREPHWAVDLAFFVVIAGLWMIVMAWPSRTTGEKA